MRYAVIFEYENDTYSAYVPDLPGCVAAGDNFEDPKPLIPEPLTTIEYIEV